jgi:hypothetical protein
MRVLPHLIRQNFKFMTIREGDSSQWNMGTGVQGDNNCRHAVNVVLINNRG